MRGNLLVLLQDAWNTAQRYLDSTVRAAHTVEIVLSKVVDHEKAWSFAYNSRPFLADHNFMAGLVGNGPVVVPKDGSDPFLASSAQPIEPQLDRLETSSSNSVTMRSGADIDPEVESAAAPDGVPPADTPHPE